MNNEYLQFLDATINYLKELQNNGTKFVFVDEQILNELKKPVKRVIKASQDSAKTVMGSRSKSSEKRDEKLISTPLKPASQKEKVTTESTKPLAIQPEIGSLWSTPELSPQEKIEALELLRKEVLRCEKCPHLVSFRHTVVFGVGDPNAELMFVGEAPGEDEDLQGEPFVGKAGQLLTKIIHAMELSREVVYIANILKCRPDVQSKSGNRPPTPQEMKTCVPYLHRQIEIIRPKVIVALGATAVEGLLGQKVQITKFRGIWQEFRGIPVMPTYHPSYLLRNQAIAVRREVWTDMLKVMEKLGMTISEKQRKYFTKTNSM
jgi:DNA polymerase